MYGSRQIAIVENKKKEILFPSDYDAALYLAINPPHS